MRIKTIYKMILFNSIIVSTIFNFSLKFYIFFIINLMRNNWKNFLCKLNIILIISIWIYIRFNDYINSEVLFLCRKYFFVLHCIILYFLFSFGEQLLLHRSFLYIEVNLIINLILIKKNLYAIYEHCKNLNWAIWHTSIFLIYLFLLLMDKKQLLFLEFKWGSMDRKKNI